MAATWHFQKVLLRSDLSSLAVFSLPLEDMSIWDAASFKTFLCPGLSLTFNCLLVHRVRSAKRAGWECDADAVGRDEASALRVLI